MYRILITFAGIIFVLAPAMSIAGECGDVNNSGAINLLDVTYLISYLYKSGPEPNCGIGFEGICGDVNISGGVNILDVTYLINYLYKGGATPICDQDDIVIDIDGNVYQTVTIGTQVWMAENLKVTHYRNGDVIPNVPDDEDWSGLVSGAQCSYDNNEELVTVYGRLYNWYAINDSRNIAPEGWHMPSDTEWQALIDYLGGDDIAGGKIKTAGTDYWSYPNTGATNESGFSALPGGYREILGAFSALGLYAAFWSGTEASGNYSWYRALSFATAHIGRGSKNKKEGISVRCIKD
ncbi:MAG: FISUMP domain-containing protein [Candidatus Zixiibacteriota bacterium]